MARRHNNEIKKTKGILYDQKQANQIYILKNIHAGGEENRNN